MKTTRIAAGLTGAAIALSGSAAMANTYDAYCGAGKNGCKVTIDSRGVSTPSGFIPAGGVLQWYQGGEGDTENVAASVAGGTAGGLAGAVVGSAALCWTIVLCPIGFFGGMGLGIAGGGTAGKKSEHTFTVVGYDEKGSKVSQHFWFVNKKPAGRVMQSLPVMTGLAMGQVRPLETISQALGIELKAAPVAAVRAGDAPATLGNASQAKAEAAKKCWSKFLERPGMSTWADANPEAAEKVKTKKYDDC
jgi:hypothetical protein